MMYQKAIADVTRFSDYKEFMAGSGMDDPEVIAMMNWLSSGLSGGTEIHIISCGKITADSNRLTCHQVTGWSKTSINEHNDFNSNQRSWSK